MKIYNDSQIFFQLSPLKKKLLVIAAVLLWAAWQMSGADASIGHIAKLSSFGAEQYYSLISALNLFSMCIAVPLVTGLGDRIGRKWLICIGITMEVVVDFIVSISTNIYTFAFFWAMSGFTSGCFMSASFLIVSDISDRKDRLRYMGYIQAAGALAMLLSPVIAGVLVDIGHPTLVYLMCVPFISIPLVILLFCYPDYRPQSESRAIDWRGAFWLLITVGLLVFYFNFVGVLFAWKSVWSAVIAAATMFSAAMLVRTELRTQVPILHIEMLKRGKVRSACICGVLFNAYAMCAAVYIVLYVQKVMQRTATDSGVVLMPQTIVYAILAIFIGGWASKKAGRFRMSYIVAGVCGAIAIGIIALLDSHSPVALIYVAMAFGGVAYAVMGTLNIPYAQRDLAPNELGAGQGMVQFFTSCTPTILVSAFGAVMNNTPDTEAGVRTIFAITCAMCLALAAYAVFFIKRHGETQA